MSISMIIVYIIFINFSNYKIHSQNLNALVFDLRDGPQLYKKYIERFGKTINGQEDYNNRYNSFMKTLRTINQINTGPGPQKVRLNRYADLTDDQKRITNAEQITKIDPELKVQTKEKVPKVESLFKFID